MLRCTIFALVVLSASSASALDVHFDDSWAQKFGQLCAMAQYGSKMTAEPICAELDKIFTAAVQAEAEKKKPKEKPAEPAK